MDAFVTHILPNVVNQTDNPFFAELEINNKLPYEMQVENSRIKQNDWRE